MFKRLLLTIILLSCISQASYADCASACQTYDAFGNKLPPICQYGGQFHRGTDEFSANHACFNIACDSSPTSSHYGCVDSSGNPYNPVADPMNKIPNITPNVNCGVGRDTGCQSGYCGYFDDTSPIDLSNMFGVLLNDILDFGAPSGFLSKFRTLSIGQDNPDSGPTGATGSSTNNFCRDEGAYVQLGGCCSDGTSIAKSGACDWKHCYPWVYQCGRFKKSCSRAECLKDPYCNLNISPSPPATYSPLKAPTPNYTYVSSYACATPNLAKPAIDSSGNYIFDQNGRQLYCPLMRGNIPTNSICIYLNDGGENNCYTDKVPPFSPNFDDAWGFNFWNDYLNDTDLKVTSSGSDQTCIEANYPGLSSIFTPGSYLTTACKYSNNFPTGATNPPTCFLDRSCFDDSSLLTRAKISVIGKFMQCYNETINNLFFTAPNSGNCKAIVLEFQKGAREVRLKSSIARWV